MAASLSDMLTEALGSPITKSRALSGGDIADASLLTTADGKQFVAKRPRMDQPDTTAIEAMMLKYLEKHSHLPVPTVQFQKKGILVMDYIDHAGPSEPVLAAESVAHHVAELHKVRPPKKEGPYGFTKETVIGPLPQVNTPDTNWCSFFTENRLLAMAQSCVNTSRFDTAFMARIEKLATKLPDILPANPDSSLLHGDLWSGNMLIDGDKAKAFIDPAISYGHREMDIAFMLLMGGLDASFYASYNTLYPLEPGFKEERLAIYQLWPLLVHVRLFAGGYVNSVSQTLDSFGI